MKICNICNGEFEGKSGFESEDQLYLTFTVGCLEAATGGALKFQVCPYCQNYAEILPFSAMSEDAPAATPPITLDLFARLLDYRDRIRISQH